MKPYEVKLGDCTIWIYPRHCVVTTFPKEMGIPGLPRFVCPSDDAETVNKAFELGYGYDVWVYTLDHEIALTWLAQQAGRPYSRTLHHAAGLEEQLSEADEASEQAGVYEYQRDLDKHQVRPWFRPRQKVLGS